MLHPQTTINCRGRLLSFVEPKIMGVLNVTKDSFFDGGRYHALDTALAQAEKMLAEGADIIDIGGMSSRPGAELISPKEEQARILPIIEQLKKRFPEAFISVDTVYSSTVERVFDFGADMINDVSAGAFDDKMYETVTRLDIPYILMHMQGSPKTMQNAPKYKDVVEEVLDFFIAEVGKLRALGAKDILIDPGFGFGKSIAHNYTLVKKMHVFRILGLPIVTGVSRKSMIYKLLDSSPEHALNGSSVLHFKALEEGSRILRVHDVAPALEVITIWKQLNAL